VSKDAAPAARTRMRSLRTDVLLMLPARMALLLCTAATSALLARALGPDGRGAVAVALGLSLVLIQFGTFGVASANPYFVAREPDTRQRLIANSVALAIGTGLLLALVGIGVMLVTPSVLRGVGWTNLAIALAGVPAALLALFLQSILLGEGRTVAYNVVELAIALLTLAALAAFEVTVGIDVRLAIAVLVASRVLAAASFLALTAGGVHSIRPDPALLRRMLTYGLRVYAATLLGYLVVRFDMLLVNAYRGPKEAGFYAVAVSLGDALSILPAAVGINLFAHIARGSDDAKSAQAFRAAGVLYLALCAAITLLAGPLIRLVYGPDFAQAARLFWWLSPGVFCYGMLTILAHHFAGRGFPIEAVLVWIPGLVINLAIDFVFLPGGGTEVAPIASSIAYALLLFLHVRLFARSAGGYAVLRPRPEDAIYAIRRMLTRTSPEPS
jgi:O-antigen/teichoic acid export membrane protein